MFCRMVHILSIDKHTHLLVSHKIGGDIFDCFLGLRRHCHLRSSFLIKALYLFGYSFFKWSRRRFLLATIFKRPKRELLSFLCFLRCLASCSISSVNKATCASADPVSLSCILTFSRTFDFSLGLSIFLFSISEFIKITICSDKKGAICTLETGRKPAETVWLLHKHCPIFP